MLRCFAILLLGERCTAGTVGVGPIAGLSASPAQFAPGTAACNSHDEVPAGARHCEGKIAPPASDPSVPPKQFAVCLIGQYTTDTLGYNTGRAKTRYEIMFQAPISSSREHGVFAGTTSPSFESEVVGDSELVALINNATGGSMNGDHKFTKRGWINPAVGGTHDGYTNGNGCVNVVLPFGAFVTMSVRNHGSDEFPPWFAQFRPEDGKWRSALGLMDSFFELHSAPRAPWIEGGPHIIVMEGQAFSHWAFVVQVFEHHVFPGQIVGEAPPTISSMLSEPAAMSSRLPATLLGLGLVAALLPAVMMFHGSLSRKRGTPVM